MSVVGQTKSLRRNFWPGPSSASPIGARVRKGDVDLHRGPERISQISHWSAFQDESESCRGDEVEEEVEERSSSKAEGGVGRFKWLHPWHSDTRSRISTALENETCFFIPPKVSKHESLTLVRILAALLAAKSGEVHMLRLSPLVAFLAAMGVLVAGSGQDRLCSRLLLLSWLPSQDGGISVGVQTQMLEPMRRWKWPSPRQHLDE